MKKIAYLALYPAQTAPSQRFRVEQYLAYWEQQGVAVSIYPFYSTRTYRVLYQQGRLFQKAFFLLADFLRRLSLLPKLSGYDAVFIQRAAVPIGPPVVEWLLKKWLRKPLIYDFDDAIWIPDPETGRLGRLVKSYAKTAQLCTLADQIVVGNDYRRSTPGGTAATCG